MAELAGIGLLRLTLLAQGSYYAATGLWSFISIRTFQKVTGPKQDLWLVRTVGLLVLVSGSTLAAASLFDRLTPELLFLAAGSCLALAGIDIRYAASGTISRIYLADAVLEGLFLAGILAALFRA